MRKGRRGSTLARRSVSVLGARGFHFRHAQAPRDANRSVGVKITISTCNRDKNNNTFWHSLLAISWNRGGVAVNSVLRLGCAPSEGGIARCQRTKRAIR